MVIANPGNMAGLTYIDNPTTTNDEPGNHQQLHPHHQQVYLRENMEPIIETNRLVIVDDDPPTSHQPLPSRNEVIPVLERHILTSDISKTPLDHVKSYSHSTVAGGNSGGKRPKPIAVYSEDLSRVTRNEGKDLLLLIHVIITIVTVSKCFISNK